MRRNTYICFPEIEMVEEELSKYCGQRSVQLQAVGDPH